MGFFKFLGLRNYEIFLEIVDIFINKLYIILFFVLLGIILYIGVGFIGLFLFFFEIGSV